LLNADNNWLKQLLSVSFVVDLIDNGMCPGFWIARKMEKCIFPACSLHTSAMQHCRKTH